MRTFFCITLVCFIVIMLFCCVFAQNRKNEYTTYISKLLIAASVTLILYLFSMTTFSKIIANVFLNAHYAVTGWLVLSMYDFVIAYTQTMLKEWKRTVLWLCASLNACSFVINTFLHQSFAFTYYQVEAEANSYWEILYKPPYYIHLTFCYLMILLTIYHLIKKIRMSPKLYRRMYWPILISILFVSMVNLLRFFMRTPLDISLLFYAMNTVVICYYSFFVTPKGIVEDTLVHVVEDMQHCIFCYDLRGRCVYANQYARTFFRVSDREILEIAESKFHQIGANRLHHTSEWSGTIPMKVDGRMRQISVETKVLFDETKSKTGYYVKLEDQTEEMDKLIIQQYDATHDKLTLLYKRDVFFVKASEIMRSNPEMEWNIVCTDITKFKLVNDLFGEETGDEILKRQADFLQTLMSDYCIAGRMVGDRFALLIPREQFHISEFEGSLRNLQKIDELVDYQVQIRIGIYEVENNYENVRVMCDRAYIALAFAQDGYQKNTVFYEKTMLDELLHERQMLGAFDYAIEDQSFCIFFQPQMNREKRLVGAEALVRWKHPQLGMVYPDEFVKIYEKSGMIFELDQYVWNLAAKKLKDWNDHGIRNISISVNISAKDFYYADIYLIFTDLVKKYNIRPELLHLEITESAILAEKSDYFETIRKLKKFGFEIEIDDFGSGYSSLHLLKQLHADILKIDMLFLSETKNQERSKKILFSVIKMAKKLGMSVITEGVENEEQFSFLAEMGSDFFQGYYFSEPVSVLDFEEKYLDPDKIA